VSLLAALPVVHPLLGPSWVSPDTWDFHHYGTQLILLSAFLLFIECGVLFPFLPGDTLLVSAALFISLGVDDKQDLTPFGITNNVLGLVVVLVLFTFTSFLGNVAGYEIGHRIGPSVYERDGRLLKREYLDKTRDFFDKQGSKALVIGRFVPFVRTFITLVAGVTQMDRRRFLVWSGVGAAVWVVAISLIGYFLGQFGFVRNNIDYVMLAILATTIIPVGYEAWRRRHDDDTDEDQPDPQPVAD
jgi:membrane-associated protein